MNSLYCFLDYGALVLRIGDDTLPLVNSDYFLTDRHDIWSRGEFRVEFNEWLCKDYDVVKCDEGEGRYTASSNIFPFCQYIKDIVKEVSDIVVTFEGYYDINIPGTEIRKYYWLGCLLLQEQLVVLDWPMWASFVRFCEENSGKTFYCPVRISFSNNGWKII